jgi:hypothetical protein
MLQLPAGTKLVYLRFVACCGFTLLHQSLSVAGNTSFTSFCRLSLYHMCVHVAGEKWSRGRAKIGILCQLRDAPTAPNTILTISGASQVLQSDYDNVLGFSY